MLAVVLLRRCGARSCSASCCRPRWSSLCLVFVFFVVVLRYLPSVSHSFDHARMCRPFIRSRSAFHLVAFSRNPIFPICCASYERGQPAMIGDAWSYCKVVPATTSLLPFRHVRLRRYHAEVSIDEAAQKAADRRWEAEQWRLEGGGGGFGDEESQETAEGEMECFWFYGNELRNLSVPCESSCGWCRFSSMPSNF